MCIAKLANKSSNYYRPYFLFRNARTAIKAFLKVIHFAPDDLVLLPAYVGWSERESSGVFDPVNELGLPYEFYRVDDKLHIDLEDFQNILKTRSIKAVIIVHYFGYVDPNYEKIVGIARENGALVLEDEAHAMFTDLVGGLCGRLGDACVFSLHKLLPVDKGGMLVFNNPINGEYKKIEPAGENITLPWEFDLNKISQKRILNAELLSRLLSGLAGEIDPLWIHLKSGEIPQTYPVLVKNVSRDKLYFMMNDAGFGVVSLYHALIQQIGARDFPVSYRLSQQILNLPVHQDIGQEMLISMVEKIDECIKELSTCKKTD